MEMKAGKILAAALVALVAAGTAFAAAEGKGGECGERHVFKHRVHGPGFSVEHVAMHNIMSELLSAKTGKTAAEIQAMFDASGPETFDKLGLDEDEMAPLFKQARATLINRAAAANLITAAQAEKLRTAKVEMRMHHGPLPPPPPDGDDDE
jgi:glycerol dehydrogenase-like iron-containing ADH family enzyme